MYMYQLSMSFQLRDTSATTAAADVTVLVAAVTGAPAEQDA